MTDAVTHFVVFIAVGAGMLLLPLIIGRLLRPHLPTEDKGAIYECGEPTIGSSYIQFDLRFYTIALLFIVFDVEVVFFFPWAVVFGSTTQLADTRLDDATRLNLSERLLAGADSATLSAAVPGGAPTLGAISADQALQFGWTAFIDIAIFFAVLLVGFAYLWKRGDLEWVRSTSAEAGIAQPRPPARPRATRPTAGRPLAASLPPG